MDTFKLHPPILNNVKSAFRSSGEQRDVATIRLRIIY